MITIAVVAPRVLPLVRKIPGCRLLDLQQQQDPEELGRVEVALTDGVTGIDPDMLDCLPRLRWLAVFTAGYDAVDIRMLARRGIVVTNAPASNATDVADHALGQIIGWVRRLAIGHREVISGAWKRRPAAPTPSLSEARIGIVGMGNIGRALLQRVEICGASAAWWGPRPKDDVRCPRMPSLLALADWASVLVLCCRADTSNRGMVSAAVLEALGSEGLLVNVSRGSLVDERMLRGALRAGRIAAAALDVFEDEPAEPSWWQGVPNIFLTPHTAGATSASVRNMLEMFSHNLAAFRGGRPLLTPVVPDASGQ